MIANSISMAVRDDLVDIPDISRQMIELLVNHIDNVVRILRILNRIVDILEVEEDIDALCQDVRHQCPGWVLKQKIE